MELDRCQQGQETARAQRATAMTAKEGSAYREGQGSKEPRGIGVELESHFCSINRYSSVCACVYIHIFFSSISCNNLDVKQDLHVAMGILSFQILVSKDPPQNI